MILYDGEEIVLHHHKGNSSYTVITFTGVNFESVARDFFMLKNVARIRDLDVIGFATKKPNWFLSHEMDEAIRVIDALLEPGRDRLVFGQSMGGYAALKFSKRLSADCVMALSPKFSIHPDECEIDEVYRKYLTDQMTNMSVKRGDIRGRVFLLSDPRDKVDSYHTERLCDVSPDIVHIPTFYSGHVVYESMSGSKPISSIIDALSTGQQARVRREVSVQRRRNPANIRNRLFLASDRHAKLVARTLVSDQLDGLKNKVFIFDHVYFIIRIIYQTAIRGEHELARRLKRKLMINMATRRQDELFENMVSANNISGSLTLDCHERVVCFDIREKCLTVSPLLQRALSLLPIYPDDTGTACVTVLGERFYLVATKGRIDLIPADKSCRGNVRFEAKGSYHTIVLDGKLATSVHGGSLTFNTHTENAWERFVVV